MVSLAEVGLASASEQMTVGGRYRLVAVVGSGAMGRVWRAYDELLGRVVAVKELAWPAGTSVAQRREAQLRAEQEARAAAGLDDPGVVRIFDVVRTTGRSWIIMEYVQSRSLYDRVTQHGPLTHREAASVGLGMLKALRTAHAAGILHRDVKPHNVLLADDGRIVLTNLGLATANAAFHGAGADGTQPLLGAGHFVAPELLRGKIPTEATDLWSLGATLYTAVEGRPPFCRASVAQSLTAALTDPIDQPENPGLLHSVIAGLLATDPTHRPTAAEAQAMLERITSRAIGVFTVPAQRLRAEEDVHFQSAAVSAVGSRFPDGSAPEEGRATTTPPPPPRQRRRSRLAAAVSAVVLVAGAAAASVWAYNDSVPTTTAPPADITVLAGPCVGATAQPLTGTTGAPISLPAGWLWHVDPADFALPVPQGWSRAAIGGTVCYSDPGGDQIFAVSYAILADDGPLLHLQAAEISALAGGTMPGYQRVSMAALSGNDSGADWEYTWQPASGPRQHVRRVLTTLDDSSYEELSWTTSDHDWSLTTDIQRNFVSGFRTASAATHS